MRGEEAVRRLKSLVLNPNHGVRQSKGHRHHNNNNSNSNNNGSNGSVDRDSTDSENGGYDGGVRNGVGRGNGSGNVKGKEGKRLSFAAESGSDESEATVDEESSRAYHHQDAAGASGTKRFLKDMIAVGATHKMHTSLRRELQDSGVAMLDCASQKASAADMAIMAEILKVISISLSSLSLSPSFLSLSLSLFSLSLSLSLLPSLYLTFSSLSLFFSLSLSLLSLLSLLYLLYHISLCLLLVLFPVITSVISTDAPFIFLYTNL
jgi:hypothetical protein